MTILLRVVQPVSFLVTFVLSLCVLLAGGAFADSFTIRCDWLDRGNVDAARVARSYTGKYPCIVNSGVMPNQAEYDLDFPVAGDYTISALYTAAGSRPVDILLDGELLVRGFTDVTGNWNTDHAKWFKQCTVHVAEGKHTVKLNCASCIPHICALRFESSVAFPKEWRLNRSVAKKKEAVIEHDREGFVGFYPLEPPNSYDYLQPYDRIPLPTPRAHRILEYTLIAGGKYKVDAEIARVGDESGEADAGDPARNELLQVAENSFDFLKDAFACYAFQYNAAARWEIWEIVFYFAINPLPLPRK